MPCLHCDTEPLGTQYVATIPKLSWEYFNQEQAVAMRLGSSTNSCLNLSTHSFLRLCFPMREGPSETDIPKTLSQWQDLCATSMEQQIAGTICHVQSNNGYWLSLCFGLFLGVTQNGRLRKCLGHDDMLSLSFLWGSTDPLELCHVLWATWLTGPCHGLLGTSGWIFLGIKWPSENQMQSYAQPINRYDQSHLQHVSSSSLGTCGP